MQRPLDEGAPQQRLSFGEKRSSTVTANPGPSNPGPAPGPNFLSSVFAARRSSERSEPLHGLWQRFRQCVSCWSIAQRKYRVEEKKKKVLRFLLLFHCRVSPPSPTGTALARTPQPRAALQPGACGTPPGVGPGPASLAVAEASPLSPRPPPAAFEIRCIVFQDFCLRQALVILVQNSLKK